MLLVSVFTNAKAAATLCAWWTAKEPFFCMNKARQPHQPSNLFFDQRVRRVLAALYEVAAQLATLREGICCSEYSSITKPLPHQVRAALSWKAHKSATEDMKGYRQVMELEVVRSDNQQLANAQKSQKAQAEHELSAPLKLPGHRAMPWSKHKVLKPRRPLEASGSAVD